MLKDSDVYFYSNLDSLNNFALQFAKCLKSNDLVFLKGDLGVGKTSFVQFLVKELSAGQVNAFSPTFNLINIYSTKLGDIIHSDLYRIKSADEVEEIGLYEEIGNKIVLIEWPEIIERRINFVHWVLEFEILTNGSRSIKYYKSS